MLQKTSKYNQKNLIERKKLRKDSFYYRQIKCSKFPIYINAKHYKIYHKWYYMRGHIPLFIFVFFESSFIEIFGESFLKTPMQI